MKINLIVERYRNANNKLILLDYDGTLVEFTELPELAIPSNRLVKVLIKLLQQPKTTVVVITGRQYQDIERLIGCFPIYIYAEHGAMVRENGKWKANIVNTRQWKPEIFFLMNQIATRCPKSFIELKNFSLAWHYRMSDETIGFSSSKELLSELIDRLDYDDLKIVTGNKVIEVIPSCINKGWASLDFLRKFDFSFDFVLSIGDDKTDEDMFFALSDNENYHTIKVGNGKETFAKYKMASVNSVISLLEELSV